MLPIISSKNVSASRFQHDQRRLGRRCRDRLLLFVIPSTAVAVDPTGEFAYVANNRGHRGRVSAFAINASSGAFDGGTGVAV